MLLDRVVSVEYALRDDDDRGDRSYDSPKRGGYGGRGVSPYRRSPSPVYRRRPSPDYGRPGSPVYDRYNGPTYDRHRGPDYGRNRSPEYGRYRRYSYFQCLLMLVILFVKFCIIKTCVWSLHACIMFSFYYYYYFNFLLESRLAADHLLEGQELERETPGSGEVVNM